MIDELREYNQAIGTYEKSLVNVDFNYSVKLTNGSIEIAEDLLSDFEATPFNMDSVRMRSAAAKFIPKSVIQSESKTEVPYPEEPLRERKSALKLVVVLGLLIIGGFLLINSKSAPEGLKQAASYIESFKEKTPEELRQELLAKERQQPEVYLTNEATWRKTLFGKTILEGSISNRATLANFKDVILEVSFLSKTGTSISTAQYAVYEFVSAGKTVAYKLKIISPTATQGIKITVVGAEQAD